MADTTETPIERARRIRAEKMTALLALIGA